MKPWILILSALFYLAGIPAGNWAGDKEYWYQKGLYHIRIKQHDKAIQAFTKALEIDPGFANAYNNRGAAWYFKKDYDRAIEDYSNALASQSGSADFYMNRGSAWFKKNKYHRAISDYTKAVALAPGAAGGFNNRGMAYYLLGEYDQAAADYSQALALAPESPEYYNNRGAAWFRMARYERAIGDYSRALAITPKAFILLKDRGIAWFKKGLYDRAVRDFTLALALYPESVDLYVSRGVVFYQQGAYEKAFSDFTRAADIDPENAHALNQLAWMLSVCPDKTYRNGTAAVKLAQRAVTLLSEIHTLETLASAHAEAGNFARALARQEEVVTLVRQRNLPVDRHEAKRKAYASQNPWRARTVHPVLNPCPYPSLKEVKVALGNIRVEPELDALVIERVKRGMPLTILGRDGPWYLTEVAHNQLGWGHEIIFTPQAETAIKEEPPVSRKDFGPSPIVPVIYRTKGLMKKPRMKKQAPGLDAELSGGRWVPAESGGTRLPSPG